MRGEHVTGPTDPATLTGTRCSANILGTDLITYTQSFNAILLQTVRARCLWVEEMFVKMNVVVGGSVH